MPDNIKKIAEPVIVVPGITATYLRDDYPVDPDFIWKVIKKDFQRIAMHPNNLDYEAIEPARVVPGQIFEVAYKEMIEELRYNLKDVEEEDIPVYPFGYDWRMPLEMIEKQLDAFIDEVIERTLLLRHYHASDYKDNPKVNLIGHSMGGLVIAGYLQSKGQQVKENKIRLEDIRVNKVVTLATPFRGSFEAPLKITTGNANLGHNKPNSRERETARITPSLYYLLPDIEDALIVDQGIPKSLFDKNAWQETVIQSLGEFIRIKGLPTDDIPGDAEKLFVKLLTDAKLNRERINSLKLEDVGLDNKHWMAVVGVDSDTRVRLQIKNVDGKVNFNLSSDDRKNEWDEDDPAQKVFTGDGTVPYKGAIPTFLPLDNLICVQPDDYGYWEIEDKAFTKVAGFHGILPNMNMLQRLIVRFFKNLEDTRGNTWGRRAPGVENWNPPLPLKEKE